VRKIPLIVCAASLLCVVFPACFAPNGPDFSTPDGSLRAVSEAMADNHPEVFWDSMPASYREDVTELVHTFAEKINPVTWKRSFALIEKTALVAREKSSFVVNSPFIMAYPAADELRGNWDVVAHALDVFTQSGLNDLDRLKTVDPREIIAETGGKLLTQVSQWEESEAAQGEISLKEKLEKMQITVLEQDEARARLRVETPGGEAREEHYLWIEERWVPEEIAADWDARVSEMRERIAGLESASTAVTPTLEAAFGAVEGILDSLAAAQTQEEFDAGLQQASGIVMGLFFMMSMS